MGWYKPFEAVADIDAAEGQDGAGALGEEEEHQRGGETGEEEEGCLRGSVGYVVGRCKGWNSSLVDCEVVFVAL